MEMNATQKDAANVLGRSARWLNDQDKAPRNKDKTYPLPELVAWFVGREVASDPLKDEKLKAEIGVLKERNRKLQFENEVTAGNMADIRLMAEMLTGLSVPMRKIGDMFADSGGNNCSHLPLGPCLRRAPFGELKADR